MFKQNFKRACIRFRLSTGSKGGSFMWLMIGVLLAVHTLQLRSENITLKRALRIAKEFVTPQTDVQKAMTTRGAGKQSAQPLYIFNDARGRGFVIVAGDDRMGEVLAYSREGKLDTLRANDGVRLLLADYRLQYRQLQQGTAQPAPRRQSSSQPSPVAPLLRSTWSQDFPYNAQTGHEYSGCVATAMAQVMYFHRWPLQGQGSNTYTVTYYNETKSADFSQSHYDWDNMLPSYKYPISATSVQNQAVAKLMSDVGIAVNMQYAPHQSGAMNEAAYAALKKYFNYSVAYIVRATEGSEGFAEILRRELSAGFPVYISGNTKGNVSGHAWVTDGFDDRGLFHMNFGWDGQSDGFYSVASLNVSQTGGEFGGRPLSFDRNIVAILAHPNKTGVEPIAPELLEDNPQLMFNGEGYLSLPQGADKTFEQNKQFVLNMAYFKNEGKKFKGDVGIGIVDADGNIVRPCPSDDHNNGGFTQRIYGVLDAGYMPPSSLITETQQPTIKVDLHDLSNGYYRLMPICAAVSDDGKWGAWIKMRRAPLMEIEIKNGRVRVSEENNFEAHFQLMEEPRFDRQPEQGENATLRLRIKNLSGVWRSCLAKMQLIDENGVVAFETRTAGNIEFDGFSATDVALRVEIPASLAPKRYRLNIELITGQGSTEKHYKVNNLHDKDAATVDIAPAAERPLIQDVKVIVENASRESIPTDRVNLSENNLLKFGLLLTASHGKAYSGAVKLYLEDTQTGWKLLLWNKWTNVSLASQLPTVLKTGWRKPADITVLNGRSYRVVVKGMKDGQEIELWNPNQAAHYITFEGSKITPEEYTALGFGDVPAGQTQPSITREGDNLMVNVRGLREVSLYTVDGRVVQLLRVNGECSAVISISGIAPGVYVVRASAAGATYMQKIRVE